MQPLSVRLSSENQQFMEQFLAKNKGNKSTLVNGALDLFRKYSLQKELIEMAKENEKEDQALAEYGMDDYLKTIQDDEAV